MIKKEKKRNHHHNNNKRIIHQAMFHPSTNPSTTEKPTTITKLTCANKDTGSYTYNLTASEKTQFGTR
jgi:hypothetical protein